MTSKREKIKRKRLSEEEGRKGAVINGRAVGRMAVGERAVGERAVEENRLMVNVPVGGSLLKVSRCSCQPFFTSSLTQA